MKKSGAKTPSLTRLHYDLDALSTFLNTVCQTHHVTISELTEMLKQKQAQEKPLLIPSSIIRQRTLGILESIVKYLRQEHELSYHEVAQALKRDDRVIWTTYNNAIKKDPKPFTISDPNIWLPLSIFTTKGPLRSLVRYLRDKKNLSFNHIAKLLNRDNRVVWAVYHK